MKNLLITALLLLSTNVFALSPLDNDGVYVIRNGSIAVYINTKQCPYYFPNKVACQNWFAAQGLSGSAAEKECCDKLN